MQRGDLVTVAVQGDYGKPRPALVIQSDAFNTHTSITILPITSSLVDAPLLRVTVEPNPTTGLRKTSQVMIDKILTVKHEKLGRPFGNIDSNKLVEIERCLAIFLGIAK
jgi:mRNA interferase MazF